MYFNITQKIPLSRDNREFFRISWLTSSILLNGDGHGFFLILAESIDVLIRETLEVVTSYSDTALTNRCEVALEHVEGLSTQMTVELALFHTDKVTLVT